MSTLQFDDAATRAVVAVYTTPGVVAQRRRTLDLLALQPGERVLDVGCGPGFLACDMAEAVAPDGHVVGIDVSEQMLTVARSQVAERGLSDRVDLRQGDAQALDLPDGSVDVLVSTQVYEYVADVDRALQEAHRVLRPGGRLLVLDTDAGSVVCHHPNPDLSRRVLDAWDHHATDMRLPRTLLRRLRNTGFEVEQPQSIPLLDVHFDQDAYLFGAAPIITNYVTTHGEITPDEADAWLRGLEQLEDQSEYFFSLNRYLFTGNKP